MKKIKIGIPRTNMYYKYGVFWKHFFLCLNCKIILSNETNNQIIKIGSNNLTNDNCFKNKIYFGHIKSLSSCDYILIYKECHNMKNCLNYKCFLENIKRHLISTQLLLFNPHNNKLIEIIKIALKITKNPLKIIYAYLYAIDKQKNHNKNIKNNQINKLNNEDNKILLLASNIEDNYIKNNITNYISKSKITMLYSLGLSKKESLFFTKHIKDKYINKEIKELIGSAYYYQYSIKSIIYLKTSNCILDDYIYNKIKEEIKRIPIINLETDNIINTETKLELLIETISNNKNK